MQEKREEMPITCPFCRGRTEFLGQEGDEPEDQNILCWCYSCKMSFAVRTGEDVDEWFRDIQFSAGDSICKNCQHEDELTCLNDKDRSCFEEEPNSEFTTLANTNASR